MGKRATVTILMLAFCFSIFVIPGNAIAAKNVLAEKPAMCRTVSSTCQYFKIPDWTAPWKMKYFGFTFFDLLIPTLSISHRSIYRNTDGQARNHGGRNVEVILDYDDYIQVMRTYENKR